MVPNDVKEPYPKYYDLDSFSEVADVRVPIALQIWLRGATPENALYKAAEAVLVEFLGGRQ